MLIIRALFYSIDKNNFSVIDTYYHEEFIADLAYDAAPDIFIVPILNRRIITVYNGSFWNSSLSSLEIGSLDSPALIGSYFYPSNTPPTNIACYSNECLIFELRSGLYSQFTVNIEGGSLDFNTEERTQITFESYAFYLQDAAIVNKTCLYFASPGASKIFLFKGEEVITTSITTTTTTTVGNATSTFSTTAVNPLYSTGVQTGSVFWGLLIFTGIVYIHRNKKRKI